MDIIKTELDILFFTISAKSTARYKMNIRVAVLNSHLRCMIKLPMLIKYYRVFMK